MRPIQQARPAWVQSAQNLSDCSRRFYTGCVPSRCYLERLELIHQDTRETYGAPRIHAELRVLGIRCARKRGARLMRKAGLIACGGRRRHARTTCRDGLEHVPATPDPVNLSSSATRHLAAN
jgi:putative transposase